jgi:predicted amidophosphoribosyltransferase
MPGSVRFVPFYPDPRGSRVDSWTVTQPGEGHVLWLRGPAEAVGQVTTLAPEYRLLPAPVTAGSGWTHALRSPDLNVSRPVSTLLDLLTEVLTLPNRMNLDFAIALDWYKVAEEGVDPYQWRNTAAGELVHQGKYRYRNNANLQRQAGLALVDLICQAIERHGVLSQASVILDVPGHDSTRVSFGSRVAATIAYRRRTPIVKALARSAFRPEAKDLTAADRESILDDEFTVPGEVNGQHVVIVDDVFRSGGSMDAVAKAARESGALAVQGICGVRTMRR